MQSRAVIAAFRIPLDIKLVFDCGGIFSVLHQFYSPARRNYGGENSAARLLGWWRWHNMWNWGFVPRKTILSSMLIDEIVKISTSGGCEFCIQGKWGCLHFILLLFSLPADLGKQCICLASVLGFSSFLCRRCKPLVRKAN